VADNRKAPDTRVRIGIDATEGPAPLTV